MESSRKSGLSSVSILPWETLSVTSRRGAPTSRRQNFISLPRRDVDFPRRDVILALLCHVVTWISHVATLFAHLSVTSRREFTRRDVIFDPSLPRRDVDLHVATSIGTALCHVATWPRTSRRRFVMCSVTSRRHPARRDVTLFLAQEWFILTIHLTYPHSSEP